VGVGAGETEGCVSACYDGSACGVGGEATVSRAFDTSDLGSGGQYRCPTEEIGACSLTFGRLHLFRPDAQLRLPTTSRNRHDHTSPTKHCVPGLIDLLGWSRRARLSSQYGPVFFGRVSAGRSGGSWTGCASWPARTRSVTQAIAAGWHIPSRHSWSFGS